MVYHSENQVAKYATKAIMPKSASLTQKMNIMHLKIKVSDSTHSTHQLKNAPPQSTVRNLPTPSVAWTSVLLGQGGAGYSGVEKGAWVLPWIYPSCLSNL